MAVTDIHITGRRAIIECIIENLNYQISVIADKAMGMGPASTSVCAQAPAPDQQNYSIAAVVEDSDPDMDA